MRSGSFFVFPQVFLLLTGLATAQTAPLTCTASAVSPLVRSEGIAEQLGDIILACNGGSPGTVFTGNLTFALTVGITNRIASTTNSVPDVLLTVDTGAGAVPSGVVAQLVTPNSIAFNGLSFTIPASRAVGLRLTNLRGAVELQGPDISRAIQAFISLGSPQALPINTSQVSVGFSTRGLLATYSSSGVRCTGSPLPSTITLSNLFATGTRFFSTRLTEGFASAFIKKDPTSDTGTRFVARYSGFPAGSRLFVPDVVAGSNAAQPTGGGDLGLSQSGGQYVPGGSGSLLLVRVKSTDGNGAGGNPVYAPGSPGSGRVAFDSVSEVDLAGGAGIAVYEVVDSDVSVRESAQFPTFLGLTQISGEQTVIARSDISLGPISTVASASTSAPVPRFAPDLPPSDCPALGDCNSSYIPKLLVDSPLLQFTAIAGGTAFQYRYVRVNNTGGGVFSWSASVSYAKGSGWLTLDPPSGINNGTVRIDAHPETLAPGTYEATLTIDAGSLVGTRTLPVSLVVTPAPTLPQPPPPAQPSVVVREVINAASFQPGPLVPGSLGTLKGSNLSGRNVSVTFDGIPAKLLFTSGEQINLQVPAELGAKSTAQLVVTVDGVSSPPQAVSLAEVAPAIFMNGILNQDNSVNSVANPAATGSIVQIFATGLISLGSTVSAKIHDREIRTPVFAGAAPGLMGVQQVNIVIPEDLPAMTTEVLLCGTGAAKPNQPVCSLPVRISLRE